MYRYFVQSLVLAAAISAVGCAGRPSHRVAVDVTEDEVPPHPLSYSPIQQASHSEVARLVDVGFDQRYDVYCVLISDSSTVYRNCQILGLTGYEAHKSAGSFSSEMKARWDVGQLFDGMLVLETEDGRLAYVPSGSVKYIEETSENPLQQQVPRKLPSGTFLSPDVTRADPRALRSGHGQPATPIGSATGQ